ncbi:hypothetical protein [Xanthocytophaga flava]|uniref:hypothetical protein n=1 Tax=Xanthocytophaga flava TaxID=3048013 RepID=UPI0028D5D44B|nr:hypothetical protein [Xanthocytophaga flavus]MDJ1470247.1 hypothetical protein [Xanthocytophaga flavus]
MEDKHILTEKERNAFSAEFLRVYGIKIDPNNELLPLHYLTYHTAKKSESTIDEATCRIEQICIEFEKNAKSLLPNIETKPIHFKNNKEAFWFGFGKLGLATLSITCFIFTGWLIQSFEQTKQQQVENISYLVERAPSAERIVNDSISTSVITLFPAKSIKDAIAGKNYVYRKECNCIDIPLHFQQVKK